MEQVSLVYQRHLPQLTLWLGEKVRGKAMLVVDANVARLYREWLATLDYMLIRVQAGESGKSQETVEMIQQALFKGGMGRKDLVITIGGGVVGDMAGYACGTYKRGIRWVNVPTTVLSMVDSSIGGKVGINTPFGKNQLGMFYFPEAIVTNTAFLDTLPRRHFINGMAEVVKISMVFDLDLFRRIRSD